MNREWLGWPWENKTRSLFDVHSPHMFVHNWETPQLTIHGDIDFRVPVTEGIATFNALQQCVSYALLCFHFSKLHANERKQA